MSRRLAFRQVMRAAIRASVLAFALGACAINSPTASPTPTPVSSLDSYALSLQAVGCGPINLRGPDGSALDLNGVWGWSSGQPAYLIRQVGDCMITVAYLPDQPAIPWFQNVCDGRIGSDFSIVGRCFEMGIGPDAGPFLFNQAAWTISFDAEGNPTIVDISFCAPADPACVPPQLLKFPDDPAAWPTQEAP